VSGRFKGTRPDYGSYFILKNVTETLPIHFPSHRHESLHSSSHLEMEAVPDRKLKPGRELIAQAR